MEESLIEPSALELERTQQHPEAPPVPIFRVIFTRIGDQVVMEPGFVDFVELRTALEAMRGGSEELTRVKLYVREKYIMNKETLIHLKDSAEYILRGMNGEEAQHESSPGDGTHDDGSR